MARCFCSAVLRANSSGRGYADSPASGRSGWGVGLLKLQRVMEEPNGSWGWAKEGLVLTLPSEMKELGLGSSSKAGSRPYQITTQTWICPGHDCTSPKHKDEHLHSSFVQGTCVRMVLVQPQVCWDKNLRGKTKRVASNWCP